MIAEILSIGSELTSGANLDTNARWLSVRLCEAGFPVGFHTTIGDDLDVNIDTFKIALRRANIILATGGLGPTADDLTRDALAKVAGAELELHQPSLDFIESLFRSRKREMPPSNRVQAMFPRGAIVIPNPNGTAPGIWMEMGDRIVVCMPGVPREMYAMFNEWVMPRLKEKFGSTRAIVRRTFRCFGAGESQIEAKLGDLTSRHRQPEVGITASQATISLHIVATAPTPEEAFAATEPDAKFIREQLGDLVVGEGDAELQSVVAQLLQEKGKTLSTAESCTGGLVGHLLTEIPGISASYMGGVVSYSNTAKMDLLGVPAELLEKHGAVSAEVAEAMAAGCRKRFQTDLAVAITGIAGPDGGTPEKPVGLVFVSLAHEDGFKTVRFIWGKDRSFTKVCSAKTALNLVRLRLIGSL
ncbi:MAG: competence/damage-inducible protein A [Planctomycetota bacterium]